LNKKTRARPRPIRRCITAQNPIAIICPCHKDQPPSSPFPSPVVEVNPRFRATLPRLSLTALAGCLPRLQQFRKDAPGSTIAITPIRLAT